MKEARASASGVDSGAAHGSDTQAQPSPAWDAQKVGPSLYRAFLQEFQSPTQGSVGSLVKRLVDKAHKHEHQRLTQELDEKEQLLQEQASQLDAMTADRDKWMMDHQQLVVSSHHIPPALFYVTYHLHYLLHSAVIASSALICFAHMHTWCAVVISERQQQGLVKMCSAYKR